MAHVVQFSTGVASAFAAWRVMEKTGEAPVLLFTDVKGLNPSPHAGEDEDNYRFAREIAPHLGGNLVVARDGRDIHAVFDDEHMLGNSRVPLCSMRLKQQPARRWMEENHPNPAAVTIYLGLSVDETHRFEPNRKGWLPYNVEFPLAWEPVVLDKQEAFDWLDSLGVKPPRLYELGFQHANCGGFCVAMGHAQAAHLLRTFPERYAYHEEREEAFREKYGKDVAFMRDRRGGTTKPLTLRRFRERLTGEAVETSDELELDLTDWGPCACKPFEERA